MDYIQVIDRLPKIGESVKFKKRWGGQILTGKFYKSGFVDENHKIWNTFLDVLEWKCME